VTAWERTTGSVGPWTVDADMPLILWALPGAAQVRVRPLGVSERSSPNAPTAQGERGAAF